jgi:hypothetical protein
MAALPPQSYRRGHPLESAAMRSTLAVAAVFGLVLSSCASAGLATATPEATALRSAEPTRSLPEKFSTDVHDAPELERLLPAAVAGRPLYRWSVLGTQFFGDVIGMTDDQLTALESDLAIDGLVLDDFSYAVAGRELLEDPPYFVTVIRVRDVLAKELPLGFGLDYPDAGDFEPATIAGKRVWRGVLEMLAQTDHLRGIPYVYLSGESKFTVVTEEPSWAADALRQLP